MEGQEFFRDTQEQIQWAVERLELNEAVYKFLRQPRRTLEVHVPVTLDNGSVETFLGYRSQHAAVFGPYKGGVRFHPSVTKEEVEALAILMTLKNAVLSLPYGGGKGGVIVDPTKLSDLEIERLARGYIRGIRDMVGPQKDIPAPDVGTDQRIVGWMLDEWLKTRSDVVDFSAFTGKSTNIGGIAGRREATGLGVAYCVREACMELKLDLTRSTVAIQGFGNVGRGAAESIAAMGARVVAVTDAYGGIYNPAGLDLARLTAYVHTHGTVRDFPEAQAIGNAELFELPVDVLIPAAVEGQITEEVAQKVRARIVAEGANGPTTPEGSKVLYNQGVLQIPDILCNGGGVTVSYFEWVQDQQGGLKWPLRKVHRQLESYMKEAFHNVLGFSRKYEVSMRDGAFLYSVNRLAQGMLDRGWIKRLRA